MQDTPTTHEKAFKINMDPRIYGTFAEIGAGQEVVRWFFRVGGASKTVAKSMSAYDMTYSDAIYGPSDRYVSRSRVGTMLDHEYSLLIERLNAKRGAETTFFTFADTVSAKSYSGRGDCHGWMGIRFQLKPNSPPNDIVIHVRLLDNDNLAQQEAMGIIGTNLIYGAFYLSENPELMLRSLLDGLTTDRIEVDTAKFSGPDFAHIDNRIVSLILLQLNLTDGALFAPNGDVLQPSEAFYKKQLIVERGMFRPVTRLNIEMMTRAREQFFPENSDVVEVMEITTHNLLAAGPVDHTDFLQRVDLLSALGKMVLISDYGPFHVLAAHLFRYTRENIGVVIGLPLLSEIMSDKYYTDLDGGILEALGRLFRNGLKLYVYPAQEGTRLRTAETLEVDAAHRHLFRHLLENGNIQTIPCVMNSMLLHSGRDISGLIQTGNPLWETLVPPAAAEMIKKKGFFGYDPTREMVQPVQVA